MSKRAKTDTSNDETKNTTLDIIHHRCEAQEVMIKHLSNMPGLTDTQQMTILSFTVHIDNMYTQLIDNDYNVNKYDVDYALRAIDYIGTSAYNMWIAFVISKDKLPAEI